MDQQEEYFRELRDVMHQGTFALARYGYTYECETKNPSQLMDLRSFVLTNDSGPKIHVSVTPPYGVSADTCVICITKSTFECFIFETYLKHHQIPYDESTFDFRNYQGSPRERFSNFMEHVTSLMARHIPHILSGEAWERIPYDLP